jgi:hypothetical protein
MFSRNEKLWHVNLANNGLDKEDMRFIMGGLHRNTSLLNVHLDGNKGLVYLSQHKNEI